MKTVFFIRHAKSSWSHADISDHDRPLNDRGLRDAPFMAELLSKQEGSVDGIVSSSANRALTTARHFAKAFSIERDAVVVIPKIYHATPEEVLEEIQLLSDELDKICIFGHNPTMTMLANDLGDQYIDNIPTCGIFKVQAAVNSWSEFDDTKTKLVKFIYPKQFFS